MPLPCDCPVHGAEGQLAKRSQEGDPVLGDVRAAQASPVGEEEATKAQAREAKQQQDQSGTDQRWVVGQTEMQVVPCLAAAHGEQQDLGLHGEPFRAGRRPAPPATSRVGPKRGGVRSPPTQTLPQAPLATRIRVRSGHAGGCLASHVMVGAYQEEANEGAKRRNNYAGGE